MITEYKLVVRHTKGSLIKVFAAKSQLINFINALLDTEVTLDDISVFKVNTESIDVDNLLTSTQPSVTVYGSTNGATIVTGNGNIINRGK